MTALEYITKQKRTHECALATAMHRTKGNHENEIANLQEKIRCCDEIIGLLQPKLCGDCAHFKNESRTPRGAIYGECDCCCCNYKNPKYGSTRACKKYKAKEDREKCAQKDIE